MSEGVSDNFEDTMSVVVGDQREVDKEDAILIPDQECEHESKKKKQFSIFSGVTLMLVGIIIFVITILVWTTTYIPWYDTAGPVLWIIIGIFSFSRGIIVYFKPPDMYNLEVIINGKQFNNNLPLRQILVTTTNAIFGITGIITMCTVGPSWWPAWNIIGLVLSILILLFALISAMSFWPRTNRMISSQYANFSGTDLKQSVQSTGELLATQVEMFRKLLPLPSIQPLNNLEKVMKEPRRITNKPVHVLSILLAMIACIVLFSAQLWDIASIDCGEGQTCFSFDDPDDTFARHWIFDGNISDRKLVILVSTPIIFLLCTTLLLLMRGSTVLRMLLSCLLSSGIGIFFLSFSFYTVQYIILMGINMSRLSFILNLVSLTPIPLLAALFMALAYSTVIQMTEENEVDSSSKSKTCLLSISTILAIVFLFVSLATMTSSNLVMMSTMQGHWNTTLGHSWDEECRENNPYHYDDYGYRHHGYDSTTTPVPKAKPEKCYTKELDHGVQNDFTFFSISQLCLTESILFLSLFVFMTGRRIPKKTLFLPGFILFASAISTIIAFFSGIVHYELKTNGFPFLLSNSITTLPALILGFVCVVIGGSLFINFITVVFRIILSIFILAFIIILTVLQALLKLASLNSKNSKQSKTGEQPDVTTA